MPRSRAALSLELLTSLTELERLHDTRAAAAQTAAAEPGGARMNVSVSTHGAARVVAPAGRLDCMTSDAFEQCLLDEWARGTRWFVFDLSGLEGISSGGLRVFISLARRLRDDGGLRFAGLTPAVKQVFDLTGLSLRVELFPARADALANYPPGPG